MDTDAMNIIWTIGLFTLIFFLLYLLLTWLVKMLMRKKENSEEPEYVTLDKYEKDIKALKRQIARLEDSLAEQASENKISAFSASITPDSDDTAKDAEQNVSILQQPKTLYLPTPSPDGVFHEAFTQPRVGRTVYQMTTIDDHHGTFSFYENRDALATAMISISQIVKTVCRVENYKNSPREITNVSEGQVVREGNTWRVVEKATVRFE
jgi:hypothetical protein